MKNLLLIAISILGLAFMAGCTDSITDSVTGVDDVCLFTDTCENGSTLESCAGDSGGYYTIGGTRVCTVTGTGSCVQQAAEQCSPSLYAKSSDSVSAKLYEALLSEKAKNTSLQKSINDMYIDLGKEIQQ